MTSTSSAHPKTIYVGSSLANTTVSALMSANGYRVTCGIEVENWTEFALIHPVARPEGGRVEIPPRDILPFHVEAMVARKTAHTATGSYGTVSWLIEGKNRRIVVMWVAPFNSDFYSNCLAVGITNKGVTEHPEDTDWYQQMYDGNSCKSLTFCRKVYEKGLETVIHKDDLIEISGIMSTGHQALVKITVRPLKH